MNRETDRWVRSDEARTKLRALLDLIASDDAHVYILRYDQPAAVIVPVEWYEQVKTAIATPETTPEEH
jgi:PHD/YefM family antitoxin component YafN of YafNO toxin-antitoxin module